MSKTNNITQLRAAFLQARDLRTAAEQAFERETGALSATEPSDCDTSAWAKWDDLMEAAREHHNLCALGTTHLLAGNALIDESLIESRSLKECPKFHADLAYLSDKYWRQPEVRNKLLVNAMRDLPEII